jgi:outer membrane protein OmpA-like peptidoglycan-associated protein
MKKQRSLQGILIGISILSLTGCATNDPYTGEQQLSDTTKGSFIGAAGGALLGGLIGGKNGALIGAGAGAVSGGLVGHHFDEESNELRQQLVGTGVQVQKTRSGDLQLIMPSDITFGFDQSKIKNGFYAVLGSIAKVLQKYRNNSVLITGYTDSVGKAEYNQELSENRAQSIGDYFVDSGIGPNRIITRGFGARYAVATNNTKTGRAENRRVTITLQQ